MTKLQSAITLLESYKRSVEAQDEQALLQLAIDTLSAQELQVTEKRMLEELLQRAYKLLEDISQPFRNVERFDVEKWLKDARQLRFNGRADHE